MQAEPVYDRIAELYKDSKTLPFRSNVEAYTIFELLGDPTGLRVLDLACGEGIYTRRIKSAGAAGVVGVDLSPAMITLAQAEEAREPLGCTYRVGDAATLEHQGAFDVVMAAYLLNYARTFEQLFAFCQTIFDHLRPGGRFVGINDNVANRPELYATYSKYGFVKASPPGRREGDPITYTIRNPDGTSFSFDNYYLSPATYERAFREVGFSSFHWRGPWLAPGAVESFPPGFWNEFLVEPPLIGLEAVR